ncbi:MAG: alcohol dehydrogenase catalytic domain-containing protein [Firmicutes bacterium]|nr:alcohol dehydrogenase catalytic domain-containing protein [Bacillota bacterium]
MLQANLKSPRQFALERVEKPKLEEGQILVKVKQTGICGSDIHAFNGKHPFISCPIVLGHEFVGTAAEGGPASSQLLGKRVTVLPSLVCGTCYNCRIGRFNICENLKVIGAQAPGAFAEYVRVPEEMVFVLPSSLDWDQGVLIEPLAVAVHAVRRIARIGGQSVLVLGAGTIGLMVIAALRAYGAGQIIAVDLSENRLRLAEELGADAGLNPKGADLETWLEKEVVRIDSSFECVGLAETVNQGIKFTYKGGNVVVLGVFEENASIEMGLVQDKELNLLGTLMYTKEDYYEAIRIMGLNPGLSRLITHRFPLRQAAQAFAVLEDQKEEALKVVLEL